MASYYAILTHLSLFLRINSSSIPETGTTRGLFYTP